MFNIHPAVYWQKLIKTNNVCVDSDNLKETVWHLSSYSCYSC